jgi:uncharacterized protein
MRLEQSFEVAAPLERVWQTLIDVQHVAPCLPGAAVTGRNDDGSYSGTFTVKIGPTTASYSGRLEMENIDESAHTATMQAQGTDKRGQGGAKATIYSRVVPTDGAGTRVDVVTDYHITGRLARFGRGGMIEDISERLLREFAKRLQNSLSSQQETVVSAPAGEQSEPAPARDETMIASPHALPASGPSPVEEAGPAPADPASGPSPVEEAGPAPGDPASGPSPVEEAGPAPAGAGPGPIASQPGWSAAEATPPPPPSPGPPPVVTPPPPPSAPPPPSPPPPRPEGAAPRPPLEHPLEPSEPIQGLSLVGSVLWSRVKRNPAPAAAAGVAVMLLLARRRRRRGAVR